jgi:hypothetical protein
LNVKPLTAAIAAGCLGLTLHSAAHAAGFLEDSKATLTLRNFYFNQDNRDANAPKSASKAEEWGQAFMLNYQSGFTEGAVGFGVDALGMMGLRLDSGKGTHGSDANSVFPANSSGNGADDFSTLGLTAKVRISKTELRYGTLMPTLPVVTYNDSRMLPQTFEGGMVTSREIDGLTLNAGRLEHSKARNSSNMDSLRILGGTERSNAFYFAGGDYKLTKNLTASYYYANLEDYYKQHFLGLVHDWQIGPGVLKSDLRYFHSSDDGANGHNADYYSNGYYGSGITKGKVDNDLYSAQFLYSLAGHTLGGGYQALTGDSNFPFLNQGDGATPYLITFSQNQNFTRAGEQTWLVRYSYDFSKVGMPGLTAGMVYLKGDHIDAAGGNSSEWERDFTLGYTVPTGTFKGLGVQWRNAVWRNDIANTRDQDENRLMLSYSISLL